MTAFRLRERKERARVAAIAAEAEAKTKAMLDARIRKAAAAKAATDAAKPVEPHTEAPNVAPVVQQHVQTQNANRNDVRRR